MRVRKRKRLTRRSRVRSPWLLLPLGVVALVLVAGGLLARDLLAVRSSLTAAQASLLDVRSAAGAIAVDDAAAALQQADRQLAEARSRSGGPLWSVAARAPVLGGSIQLTREVVRTASVMVDVADRAVDGGTDLLGGGLSISVEDGQLDLSPLHEARELLDGLPLERLREARADLAATQPRWAPQEILDGRDDTLDVATEAVGTIERGQALLSVLPPFLGEDGTRRYFLGIQTPAELRGTGGLLGYYAVLTAEGGRLTLGDSDVYDALDDLEDGAPSTGRIGLLRGDLTQGAMVSDEYAARYGHTAASAFFSNINVDPDLPTTAAIMLDLYEQRTGDRLDGVVLVDPVGLELILQAIGDGIPVPGDLPPGVELPEVLPADGFAEFASIGVYDQLGSGRSAERKRILTELSDAAFAQVFDGAWDGVAVSRAVGDAAGSRHLQVYSALEEEQQAFDRVGVAGSLRAPEGADLLTVTANNAVGGKQDVHLGHRVVAEVTLEDPRRDDEGAVTVARRTELQIEVDNPLPGAGMDEYIIGNCLVGTLENQCFDGPPGHNRTWFTAWTPGPAELEDPVAAVASGLRPTAFRGFAAFDRFLETPPESTADFSLAWNGRAPASTDRGELIYELSWWAQSKATPTQLDVTVAPPDGWRIIDVEFAGGGTGHGLGAFGDADSLEVAVDGQGRAHLSGNATADALLHVRMVGDDGS